MFSWGHALFHKLPCILVAVALRTPIFQSPKTKFWTLHNMSNSTWDVFFEWVLSMGTAYFVHSFAYHSIYSIHALHYLNCLSTTDCRNITFILSVLRIILELGTECGQHSSGWLHSLFIKACNCNISRYILSVGMGPLLIGLCLSLAKAVYSLPIVGFPHLGSAHENLTRFKMWPLFECKKCEKII